jgi:hypothetical protein
MANTNAPFGVRWLGIAPGGGAAGMQLVTRKISYGDTTAAYRGDTMQGKDTGYVSQGSSGVPVSQHAGILWGVEYLSNSQGKKVFSEYWPGSDCSSDATAYLIPFGGAAPQLFVVQAKDTAFTFADIGMNCDIAIGTGSVTAGCAKSGATLDRATINTTSTLPFRIVDLYSSIAASGENGTDDTASYNRVVVRSNSLSETGL